jgi:carboxyl-terminal processing protease
MKSKTLFFITTILTLWTAFLFRETINLYFLSDLSDNEKISIEKLQEVISLTQKYYVDDVNWETVSSKAIEGMLHSLDPHSVYFTPEEAMDNDENFEGKYQGIGIQYDVIDGYINVISVIPGSPSEKVGIFAGDIIVEIDGESAHGITNSDVPRKLKGPKNTIVRVGINRSGFDEILYFDIVRDEIPIFTVNTSFMANDSTGYIWINRFASTTADELENALITLEKSGMKQLVLDLRGNGGGFLRQSVQVVGKFISDHKKVVYTKGRLPKFAEEHYTDDYGRSIDRNYPLIVLINHSSASASEIVAGALQDYDRALIAGTRSFGKGLVQNEFVLTDGSRLRLTTSKYYTPSGRLIQKPYRNKSLDEYYAGDYLDGDSLVNIDSTVSDSVYHTSLGRNVYASGGIMPDTVINYESSSKSPKLTQKLFEKRLFYEVAALFAAQNKNLKNDFDYYVRTYKLPKKWLDVLKNKAADAGIHFPEEDWKRDQAYIQNRLKAEIARNFWSQKEFWQVILQHDNQFNGALNLFSLARKIQNPVVSNASKN